MTKKPEKPYDDFKRRWAMAVVFGLIFAVFSIFVRHGIMPFL